MANDPKIAISGIKILIKSVLLSNGDLKNMSIKFKQHAIEHVTDYSTG